MFHYQRVRDLREDHDKTQREIADLMGISPKTVYTRLARGKKLLLDSLNGVETDEKN